MPLIVGPPPTIVTPTPGPAVNDVGTIYATWIDPNGDEYELSNPSPDLGWFTPRPGMAGWGATSYEFSTDPLPRGGDEVRYIRVQPARITWPLHIFGETHQEFVDRLRVIRRAIMLTVHRQTPGILRVARPDGTAREIEAYYEDGFGLEAGDGWLSATVALTLFCPDGYWRDAEATHIYRAYSPGVSFLAPFPTLSGSQVLGETTVSNAGDVTAWPEWTVTGPMTSLVATNHTSGREFTLTYTLTGGQSVTIATQQPAVTGPAGVNLVGSLDWPDAYLWGLEPGDNELELVVNGSAAGTSIDMAYRARYEGA